MATKKKTTKKLTKKPAGKPVTRAAFDKLVERVKDAQATASTLAIVRQTDSKVAWHYFKQVEQLVDAHNGLFDAHKALKARYEKLVDTLDRNLAEQLKLVERVSDLVNAHNDLFDSVHGRQQKTREKPRPLN